VSIPTALDELLCSLNRQTGRQTKKSKTMLSSPVAYLGGARCDAPPLWLDYENFLQATLYEKERFLPFSSKFQQKNGRICGFY